MPDLKSLFDVANQNLDLKGQSFDQFVDNLRDTGNRESLFRTLQEGGVQLGKDFVEFDNNVFSSPDFHKEPSTWEAFKFGLQSSGVAIPFARPTATPPSQESATQRFASGVGQALGDAPIMAATIGAAALQPEVGVPAIVASSGAALAVPEMIRKYAMDVYEKGAPADLTDYAKRIYEEVKAGAHGFVTGATATLPGALLRKGLTQLGAQQLAKTGTSALAAGTAIKPVASAVTHGAEVGVDITSGAVLQAAREGRLPNYMDFVDNAAPFIALHGVTNAPALMRKIFSRTGVRPETVAKAVPGADLNKAIDELNKIVVSKEPEIKVGKFAVKKPTPFNKRTVEKPTEEASYMTPSQAEKESPLGYAILKQHYLDEVQRLQDAYEAGRPSVLIPDRPVYLHDTTGGKFISGLDREYVTRRVNSLPPPDKGKVRLFRAADKKATAHEWFTDNIDEAMWYLSDKRSYRRLLYADIDMAKAESARTDYLGEYQFDPTEISSVRELGVGRTETNFGEYKDIGMSPDQAMDYEAWWRATVSRGEVVDILPPTPAGQMGPGRTVTKPAVGPKEVGERTEGVSLGQRRLITPPSKKVIGELPEGTESASQLFWQEMKTTPPTPWQELRAGNTEVLFKSGKRLEPETRVVPAAETKQVERPKIRFTLEAPDEIEPRTLERVRKAFAIVEERYPKLVRLMDEPSKIPNVHPLVKGGPLTVSLIKANYPEDYLAAYKSYTAFNDQSTPYTIESVTRHGIEMKYSDDLSISGYVGLIKHELQHLAYNTLSPGKFLPGPMKEGVLRTKYGNSLNAEEKLAARSEKEISKAMTGIVLDEVKKSGVTVDEVNVRDAMRYHFPIKGFDIFYDLLDGIYQVLGGERVGITPQAFNKASWDAAKPLFEKAFKGFRDAGMSTVDALKELDRNLLPHMKPYLEEFRKSLPKVNEADADPALSAWKEIYPDKPTAARQVLGSATGYIRSMMSFPEQAFKGLVHPARHSSSIIEADLLKNWMNAKDATFIDGIEAKLPGGKLLGRAEKTAAANQLRPAVEKLYELKRTNPDEAQRLVDNSQLYSDAKMIIDWFDNKRKALINYKLDTFERMVPDKMKPAFFQALHDVSNITEETSKATEKTIKRLAADYDVSPSELMEHVREYHKLKNWGLSDYLTNIERGMWRVVDKDGQVRAVGLTKKDARNKMNDLRAEGVQFGDRPISPEFHEPVNPLEPRKGILKGEKNILDAMRTYSYIVNRKLTLDPVRIGLDQAYRADEGHLSLPKWTRKILSEQMEYAYGKYGAGDKFFDDIAKLVGGKPMGWSRGLRQASTFVTITKMGYKPAGGLINYTFGKAHTIWYNGVRSLWTADSFLKTPEGKAFLARNEPYLGQGFSVTEGGMKPADKPYKPLWFWEIGEADLRPQCLAANYLRALNEGKSPLAAELYARHALRLQQVVYNAANLPMILRYPITKYALLKFKSYFANEFRVLANLPGADKMKMISTMIALTGPAGALAIMKSLPLLGAIGFFQDAEEWMAKKMELAPNVNPAYGLPGLAGMNISGMATPQFFTDNPEDYFGPFISEMVDLYKGLIGPILKGESFVLDDATLGRVSGTAASLFPVYYYWRDLLNYTASPDGWVRDSQGFKKYQLPGLKLYNQLMMLIGIPSVAKTKMQVLDRQMRRQEQLSQKNKMRKGKQILVKIDDGENIPDGWIEDAVMLGMDVKSLVENHKKMQQLDPAERALIRNDWVLKLKAMKIYEE